jgi:hypothetical protein
VRPVIQTYTGENGNCFAACLASILEIPLSDIPDFGGDDVFLDQVAQFLEPMDLYYIQVPVYDGAIERMFEAGDTFHTIEGTSPRGGQHAVVGCNGVMVHDPHPFDGTGRGLVDIDCYGLICKRMTQF